MTEPGTTAVLHFRTRQTLHCELDKAVLEGDTTICVRTEEEAREVDVNDLKAIFFLRSAAADPPEFDQSWSKLAVEFADGETIRGAAAPYAMSLPTFFLFPIERSKNERVLVVSSAVVSIDAEKL